MDETDQLNFADLQRQDRFKQLKRSLKSVHLKPIPWSTCSSIHGEQSDLNYTSNLHTSRTGSEVLTSSQDLKGLIPKRVPSSPMATSSMKQFSGDQSPDDRKIMPPPSDFNKIRPSTKRSAPADSGHERTKFRRQATRDEHFYQEKETNPEFSSCNDYSDDAGYPQDVPRVKTMDWHFYRWKVFLSDQGELLIKGSLNNEKKTRSKPVVKMISSSRVESKYKHTYHLHGNLIDENRELPKYIYSKFYNGFPDDWKNVYEIWKSYVAQGCKDNFRWPTDVSFSDDDLNSEITEITQNQKTSNSQDFSFLEKSTPLRSSGYSSDIQHDRDSRSTENTQIIQKRKAEFVRNNTSDNLNQTRLSLKENDSVNLFEVTNDRSCSGNLYAALNYAHNLKDIIFEDKLTIITQNLLHENCPKEYARTVTRTIDCLNYLLSHKYTEFNEIESNKPKIESKSNELIRKCSTPLSCEPNLSTKVAPQNNEIAEKKVNEKIEKRGHFDNVESAISPIVTEAQEECLKTNSDDSDSEVYAGVRKDLAEKILQSKVQNVRHRKFDKYGKIRAQLHNKERQNNLVYDSNVGSLENRGPNPLREDRVPLEMLRTADYDDNTSPSKTFSSNKLPNSVNNERRQLMIDKENMKMNKQDEFLHRRDSQNLQRLDSQNLQRMETQNPQNINSNSNKVKQKPAIINVEKVNLNTNFKQPLLNEENNRANQREEQSSGSKFTEVLNPEEKVAENKEESLNNESFGSENNPKLLDLWSPIVNFDDKKHQLVFQGVLFNAYGKPMKKKFTTSQVVRRVSSTIVETADKQFYKLIGKLNDNKYAVPKELLPQCRNGCPANIENFCISWLKLKGDQKSNQVSSRGRNILPPLNFWADERIIKRDGEVVYNPGEPKEQFSNSIVDSPTKPPKTPDHITSNETVKGTMNFKEERHLVKKKVVHKLNFESSDSEEEKIKESKQTHQNNIDLNEASSKNEIEFRRPNQKPRNSRYPGLRTRQKADNVATYPDEIQIETKHVPKSGNAALKIHCTYNKNVRNMDITLSDDQMSIA